MKDYPAIGERLYRRVLPNGLTVLVVPRPGFTRKSAYFVTNFGSLHTDFRFKGKEYHAPAGVAHYLEHKMFDLPGHDVYPEFAAMGASANAFTSYDLTAYYFTTTHHFADCLRLLLSFVSTPYFTEESVEKEREIIGQEIDSNLDYPDSVSFDSLMEEMYRKHPLHVPILGTRETIAEITPEWLHLCHEAFYVPANMVLCVVGDVDPESVSVLAAEVLGDERKEAGEKLPFPAEPAGCPFGSKHIPMDVAMPMFQMGFKLPAPKNGREAIRLEILGDLATEALFGESSRLYLRLYEEGVIDSSFGGGCETLDGAAMVLCSGDSRQAEQIREEILTENQRLCRDGIPEEAFLRIRRCALGRRIRDLDSFEGTCYRLCAYALGDYDYFNFPELYASLKAEDLQKFLEDSIRRDNCSMTILDPIDKEET